eukprot:4221530-Pleurochrysis_carterae.AAC.2
MSSSVKRTPQPGAGHLGGSARTVRQAGLEQNISLRGLLALIIAKPIGLRQPAVQTASVPRDRRVQRLTSVSCSHVAASRNCHVAF